MTNVVYPGCGSPAASVRGLSEYHYDRESGLENVWLAGGVTETTCAACGGAFIGISKEQQLLQVITIGLLTEPTSLRGPELRFIRRSCELSQNELATMLACRRETIAEREARSAPGLSLAEEIGLRLILLRSFRRHLAIPGTSTLATSQLDQLRDLEGFFDRVATRVAPQGGRAGIQAALEHDRWTWQGDSRGA